jgi:hypothetical protein
MNPEDERATTTPAADGPADQEEPTHTPEEIQAEIEATRAELGDTVEALAEKADVKGRAERRLGETKRRAQANPVPLAIVAGVGALAAIAWLRRR